MMFRGAGLAGLVVLATASIAGAQATTSAPDSVVITMRNSGFSMGTGHMRIDALGGVHVTSSMTRGNWAPGNRSIQVEDFQSLSSALVALAGSSPPRVNGRTDEGCVLVMTDANMIDFTVYRADTTNTVSHYLGCSTYRDSRATARGKTLDNLTAWAHAVAAGQPPPKDKTTVLVPVEPMITITRLVIENAEYRVLLTPDGGARYEFLRGVDSGRVVIDTIGKHAVAHLQDELKRFDFFSLPARSETVAYCGQVTELRLSWRVTVSEGSRSHQVEAWSRCILLGQGELNNSAEASRTFSALLSIYSISGVYTKLRR